MQTKYLSESNLQFNQAWKIMDMLRIKFENLYQDFKNGRVKSALFIAQYNLVLIKQMNMYKWTSQDFNVIQF